jgi:glycosyltransferase involved in cell wall biosynthesis
LRALLVSNLFPPDIGGPATYVSRLANDLHSRGHTVQLVVCAEDPSAGENYPFPVHRVSRKIFMPVRLLIVLWWVMWYARNVDVVYVNGLELPGVLGSKLMRKPAALKVVGDFAWEYAVRHSWTNEGIDEFQVKRFSRKVELVRRIEHWYAQNVARAERKGDGQRPGTAKLAGKGLDAVAVLGHDLVLGDGRRAGTEGLQAAGLRPGLALLRAGAQANDESGQRHESVGRAEAGDHDRRVDHEAVGDLDHDRRRGERGVELRVEVGRVGHHLADRRLVAGL